MEPIRLAGTNRFFEPCLLRKFRGGFLFRTDSHWRIVCGCGRQTIGSSSQARCDHHAGLRLRARHRQSHDRLAGADQKGGEDHERRDEAENLPCHGQVKQPGKVFGFRH